MNDKPRLTTYRPNTSKADRAADVAAFDAMTARRPLKPPPTRFEAPPQTAAQLALRADKKAGIA